MEEERYQCIVSLYFLRGTESMAFPCTKGSSICQEAAFRWIPGPFDIILALGEMSANGETVPDTQAASVFTATTEWGWFSTKIYLTLSVWHHFLQGAL